MWAVFEQIKTNQPLATLLTGTLAVVAVILSQIWLDARQRKDHRHSKTLKTRELHYQKKEQLLELINRQLTDITRIESLFASWAEAFKERHNRGEMQELLLGTDRRLIQIKLLLTLYFPHMNPYAARFIEASDRFLANCQDFASGAALSEEEFLSMDLMEIIELCNEYGVSYLYFAHHFEADETPPNDFFG